MSKKIVLSSLLIGLIVVFLTCDLNKISIEWVPTLDDTTVYGLNKQISDLRKNLETFQQFQKKGQRVKANEQMTILNKGLENLDNYYLPLTNARAHLSSAYKLTLRKDFPKLSSALSLISIAFSGIYIKTNDFPLRINSGTSSSVSSLYAKKTPMTKPAPIIPKKI